MKPTEAQRLILCRMDAGERIVRNGKGGWCMEGELRVNVQKWTIASMLKKRHIEYCEDCYIITNAGREAAKG